jgi:DNA-binding response OmpR family regulator
LEDVVVKNSILRQRSWDVWGTEYFATRRAIDTTIARLRSKIKEHGERIQGINGLGFRCEEG